MKVKRLYELKTIKSILTDPEIEERIAEDGINLKIADLPVAPEVHWIGFYTDYNMLVGLGVFHPMNTATVKYHINVLKGHRAEFAAKCGAKSLEYFIRVLYKYDKMVAEVPVNFNDVYNFCLKFGLQLEGINRKSVRKGGVLYDQYALGITREEAKSWVQQQSQPPA